MRKYRICPDDPSINVPAGDLPEVVGAYFGRHYAYGVLHPTGQCMNNYDEASTFCPICHVLVEQIDPNQHWWIDRENEKTYRL